MNIVSVPVYVRLSQVQRTHGIGVSTAKRLIRIDPTFPRVVRLSPRLALLDSAALTAWVEAQRGKPARDIRAATEAVELESAL